MSINYEYYFSDTKNFYIPEVFEDIKYPWDALEKAATFIQNTIVKNNTMEVQGITHGATNFYNNYAIGKGTIIYNDVTIIGPVIIGENCEIMPDAILRPGTIIGNNCFVGHGCEIKNSVVQNHAKVQSFTFVGDSVIGKSARVGSGAILCNRKFDQSTIKIKSDDGSIDTGVDYFGCILGDNSRIGGNSVTQPGTLIGKYCWIYPMTSVRGFVPEAKRVFHKNPIIMEDNERIDLMS